MFGKSAASDEADITSQLLAQLFNTSRNLRVFQIMLEGHQICDSDDEVPVHASRRRHPEYSNMLSSLR
jgi:hypothetical protein